MRTVTQTVYEFEELHPNVQRSVLEKMVEQELNKDQWIGSIVDDARECAHMHITYLSDNLVEGSFIYNATESAHTILSEYGVSTPGHQIAHQFLMSSNYLDEGDKLTKLEEQFLKDMLEVYRVYYKTEYEYIKSGQAAVRLINIESMEFLENGERYFPL